MSSTPGAPPSGFGSSDQREATIRTHAYLAATTFLVVMPLGVLIPRYFRTFTNRWWHAHWVLNSVVSGSLIIAAWVKGNQAQRGSMDTHKRIGLVIFGLCIAQMSLGTFIHYVRVFRVSFPFGSRRPPQNYMHALLGLTILALAEYQVHNGMYSEWPRKTGNSPMSKSAKHAWLALTIIFWCLYAFGLLFLPRQYRQERENARSPPEKA
ncbi:hypothetical protein BC826DRAFT_680155 [Russula brevipes]|nr:hypothetical protein BC826DRAFT_680155 [Russula brevipes]